MKIFIAASLITGLISLTGCSSVNWERTVYETLENKRQMDCQKVSNQDCSERQSYDKYQRSRKESAEQTY